jgi:hypothetical protein
LRNVGLVTLADLVAFINVYGYRWHARIKGFGVLRAQHVLAWLQLEQDHLGLTLAGSVHEPKSKHALRLAELMPTCVLTSAANGLARMQANPALAGERGIFAATWPTHWALGMTLRR